MWEQENLQSLKGFLRNNNSKGVVPTLEAQQKMVELYHIQGFDTLKLGCTLPNLADFCLHKFTSAKFSESDKGLLSKVQENLIRGPSIVFTRQADVDEADICKSTSVG